MEVEVIRNSDCPVLIIGETGTGKEILADYIHANSLRREKRFVKVSLSSLPGSLFESELFGHEKGAYTGAHQAQQGFFEAANNATIYLDDIDDFPIQLQSKLLRVIENKELIHIGSNKPIDNDARLISSSKAELKDLVEKGDFRSDLFYRLSVFRIYIPPLRERKDDIPILLEYFISKAKTENKTIFDINKINLAHLIDYNWKGNVRELRNFAEKLMLYPIEEIYDNFENIFTNYIFGNGNNNHDETIQFQEKDKESFENMVESYERELITKSLKNSFGNVKLASRILIIKHTTLRDKIKKYNIDPTRYKK
jgi:Nif-specific regulatory protein